QRDQARAGDVGDVDEVALLAPVFVDERRKSAPNAADEDRGSTGVGVVEALPCTVRVEEAKGDHGEAVDAPKEKAVLLLVAFVQGVDALAVGSLRLWGR